MGPLVELFLTVYGTLRSLGLENRATMGPLVELFLPVDGTLRSLGLENRATMGHLIPSGWFCITILCKQSCL